MVTSGMLRGCRAAVFENGTCALGADRRPDTEVGLRLVRASVTDLRKGESGVIRCRCEQLESALAALHRRPTKSAEPRAADQVSKRRKPTTTTRAFSPL
eukprot:3801085-Prymnesium_polylepis.1